MRNWGSKRLRNYPRAPTGWVEPDAPWSLSSQWAQPHGSSPLFLQRMEVPASQFLRRDLAFIPLLQPSIGLCKVALTSQEERTPGWRARQVPGHMSNLGLASAGPSEPDWPWYPAWVLGHYHEGIRRQQAGVQEGRTWAGPQLCQAGLSSSGWPVLRRGLKWSSAPSPLGLPSPVPFSFSEGLRDRSFLRYWMCRNVFYFALCLNDCLAACGILGSQLLAFSTLKTLFHCLLASVVADEMLIVKSIIGPLQTGYLFFLVAFRISLLFLLYYTLVTRCLDIVFFFLFSMYIFCNSFVFKDILWGSVGLLNLEIHVLFLERT